MDVLRRPPFRGGGWLMIVTAVVALLLFTLLLIAVFWRSLWWKENRPPPGETASLAVPAEASLVGMTDADERICGAHAPTRRPSLRCTPC
jgi:hypothetical protein